MGPNSLEREDVAASEAAAPPAELEVPLVPPPQAMTIAVSASITILRVMFASLQMI
jgi:hypothetical protein